MSQFLIGLMNILRPKTGVFSSAQVLASSIQEQTSTAKSAFDADWKGVQEVLTNANFETSVPSFVTNAHEDLKALLRQ